MFETIVQGLIQGLTEFLPVSSSGHLVLSQNLFHFRDLDPAFDVFVQGGTVISLLLYYFPKLKSLKLTPRYLLTLLLATIPAGLAGVLLENSLDTMFGSTQGLALGFLLTTAFIWSSRYAQPRKSAIGLKDAGLIGLAQAAAILPSLSRSGSTIGAALLLGIRPEEAFNFSFLMSIPIMAGSTLLSARHLVWNSALTSSYLIGFFTATVVGYLTLVLLAKIMQRGRFYLFAPYTLFLAIVSYFIS